MQKTTALLSTIAAVLFFTCAAPDNPLLNPKNVKAEIVLDTHTTYADTNFSIRITFLASTLVDSARLNFGDNHDTLFLPVNQGYLHNDTLKVYHNYKIPGTYTVRLTAFADNEKNTTIDTISVLGKTAVIEPDLPAYKLAILGITCTLSVETRGTHPITYKWHKGLNLIHTDTTPNLIIGNVSFSDTGNYCCVISNNWGKPDTSGFLKLIVQNPTIPDIKQLSGPTNGERSELLKVNMSFEITDMNGIDTAYSVVNGLPGPPLFKAGSIYQTSVDLTRLGENVIQIVAKNSQKVATTKSISIIYNRKPVAITTITPDSGKADVEYVNGVKLKWTKVTDPDGDSIRYSVQYGKQGSNLASITTLAESLTINNLQGSTTYNWSVTVMAQYDTINYPKLTGNFFTFTTIDHQADISSFADMHCSVNDTVHIGIVAEDPEGIKEYQWDYQGDGTFDITTASGNTIYKPTGTGIYKVVVKVVDLQSKFTLDTAILTVTNNKPVVNIGSDTLHIDYKQPITLDATVTDDGTSLKYYWCFQNNGNYIPVSTGDTSFASPTDTLPRVLLYQFKAVDDDNNMTIDTQYIKIDLQWQIATTDTNILRPGFSSCVYHSTIYVAGGYRDMYTNLNDVWKSTDGKSWSKIQNSALWSGRYNAQMFTVKDTMFIAGGTNGYNGSSETWGSIDGINWDKNTNLPAYYQLGLYNAATTIAQNGYLRFIGGTGTNWVDEISYDSIVGGYGMQDLAVLVPLVITPRENPCVYTYNDTIWVVGGSQKKDCFYLLSPIAPTTRNATCNFEAFNTGSLYIINNQMWLFADNGIWLSENRAISWKLIESSPPWVNCTKLQMYNFKGNICIITDKGIWYYTGSFMSR